MSEPFNIEENNKLKEAAAIESQIFELRQRSRNLRASAEKSRKERENYALIAEQKRKAEELRKDRQVRLSTSANMLERHVRDVAARQFHLEPDVWNTKTVYDLDAPLVDITFRFRPKV